MHKQSPNRLDLDHTITRRKFLGTTAAQQRSTSKRRDYFPFATICFSEPWRF